MTFTMMTTMMTRWCQQKEQPQYRWHDDDDIDDITMMLNYPEARMTVPFSAITRIGGEFVLKQKSFILVTSLWLLWPLRPFWTKRKEESIFIIFDTDNSAERSQLKLCFFTRKNLCFFLQERIYWIKKGISGVISSLLLSTSAAPATIVEFLWYVGTLEGAQAWIFHWYHILEYIGKSLSYI